MIAAVFLLFARTLAVCMAETNNAIINENLLPLSDRLSIRTVLVKNKEGKGIAGAKVDVPYWSVKHPRSFVTDAQGKAEVQVTAGFAAIQVRWLDNHYSTQVRDTEVRWPLEVVLPTTANVVTNKDGFLLPSNQVSVRTVVVKNSEGKPIENARVYVTYDSFRNRPFFVTDPQGRATVELKAGATGLCVSATEMSDISQTVRYVEVEWPFEVVLPTKKTKFSKE